MARNNTQNNTGRATHKGNEVVIVRMGEKNSRVHLPNQSKGESYLVPTTELEGVHKIEKAKPVQAEGDIAVAGLEMVAEAQS